MSNPAETPETTIVTYRPEFREAFARLNRTWLEAYSLLEPADVEFLDDPELHILSSGGEIFCALQAGEVVGTCAAIRVSPNVFELAKLAVAPVAQGRGLGRRLSERVLSFARDAGASKIELTSTPTWSRPSGSTNPWAFDMSRCRRTFATRRPTST